MTYELVLATSIERVARQFRGDQRWKVYAQDASRIESVPLFGQPGRYGAVRITDGWQAEGSSYQAMTDAARRHGPGRYLIAMFTHPETLLSTAWRGRLATVVEVRTDGTVLPALVPGALPGDDDDLALDG